MVNQSAAEGSVRQMTENDLVRVLEWRNHPEVRRHMYTQHEISLDEHRAWFAKASSDRSRHLLIFQIEDSPLGFVHFHAPHPGRIAEWGFYLSPDAPKGCGSQLGQAALTHGFGAGCFHKVCGEALASNERSIRFHLKLGFAQEGVLRDQHFDGTNFHTVVRFGLLRDEWPPTDHE